MKLGNDRRDLLRLEVLAAAADPLSCLLEKSRLVARAKLFHHAVPPLTIPSPQYKKPGLRCIAMVGDESRGSEFVWWRVAAIGWAALVLVGFLLLWRYKATPGAEADAPSSWPAQSTVQRDAGRLTLLMFAHPQCP